MKKMANERGEGRRGRERWTRGEEKRKRVKVLALAGGQHEELGGQKQSAQSRDSLNRSQYKETALLDTTP